MLCVSGRGYTTVQIKESGSSFLFYRELQCCWYLSPLRSSPAWEQRRQEAIRGLHEAAADQRQPSELQQGRPCPRCRQRGHLPCCVTTKMRHVNMSLSLFQLVWSLTFANSSLSVRPSICSTHLTRWLRPKNILVCLFVLRSGDWIYCGHFLQTWNSLTTLLIVLS